MRGAAAFRIIFTSAKEVMFLPDFVCLFVSLCVSKITQKVVDESFCNFLVLPCFAMTAHLRKI